MSKKKGKGRNSAKEKEEHKSFIYKKVPWLVKMETPMPQVLV
jgi:hypothetical protein